MKNINYLFADKEAMEDTIMEQKIMTNGEDTEKLITGIGASREFAISTTKLLRDKLASFHVGEIVGLNDTPVISFATECNCEENIRVRNQVRPKGFTKGKRTGRVVQVTPHFVTVEMIALPKTSLDTPREAWCESFGMTDLKYLYRVEAE